MCCLSELTETTVSTTLATLGALCGIVSSQVCAYIRLETSVSLLITRPTPEDKSSKGSAGDGVRTHATMTRRPCRAAPLEGLLLP
jgi:hypothetical protein